MADSNITKRALASALKELMREMPFSKISVSNICERCDMNRKSFYYHFKDKYDLVNWIFDTEFIAIAKSRSHDTTWDAVDALFTYFYENKNFYRKVLKIEDRNSFSMHFREILQPTLRKRIEEFMGSNMHPFYIDFFADAVMCVIERWLLDKNCMPPEQITDMLKNLVIISSEHVVKSYNNDNENEAVD